MTEWMKAPEIPPETWEAYRIYNQIIAARLDALMSLPLMFGGKEKGNRTATGIKAIGQS